MSSEKTNNVVSLHGETCKTSGTGLWSEVKRTVSLRNVELIAYTGSPGERVREFGELRVRFDTATWDVEANGLIYTDNEFMKELRTLLEKKGFSKGVLSQIDYSEAGMQGDDYISLDVDNKFCAEWRKLGLVPTKTHRL